VGGGRRCSISDPALAAAVAREAQVESVAEADVASLTVSGVADLQGIDCLARLQTLDMRARKATWHICRIRHIIGRCSVDRQANRLDPRRGQDAADEDDTLGCHRELQETSGALPEVGENIVNKAQKERFERAGWKIGTVAQLLELTPAEAALIETKLRLGDAVRLLRRRNRLSQAALAKLIGSSQPRVAKLENRDPEVSLDLQMKAIFAARPAARRELGALISKWSRHRPRSVLGRRPPLRKLAR
jgi:predicted XRE-type DNA-binding protein